jgi:hypothetical protein
MLERVVPAWRGNTDMYNYLMGNDFRHLEGFFHLYFLGF